MNQPAALRQLAGSFAQNLFIGTGGEFVFCVEFISCEMFSIALLLLWRISHISHLPEAGGICGKFSFMILGDEQESRL